MSNGLKMGKKQNNKQVCKPPPPLVRAAPITSLPVLPRIPMPTPLNLPPAPPFWSLCTKEFLAAAQKGSGSLLMQLLGQDSRLCPQGLAPPRPRHTRALSSLPPACCPVYLTLGPWQLRLTCNRPGRPHPAKHTPRTEPGRGRHTAPHWTRDHALSTHWDTARVAGARSCAPGLTSRLHTRRPPQTSWSGPAPSQPRSRGHLSGAGCGQGSS